MAQSGAGGALIVGIFTTTLLGCIASNDSTHASAPTDGFAPTHDAARSGARRCTSAASAGSATPSSTRPSA
jgi:hypothetical protein